MKSAYRMALACSAAWSILSAAPAFAQSVSNAPVQMAAADATLTKSAAKDAPKAPEEVIVTGTRVTGMKVVDSPAPIVKLGGAELTKVGQPDLLQTLNVLVPSFNAESYGADTAALTLTARLRGLSPNHTLVLVNGKRRHSTANFHADSGELQGSSAADLSLIPLSAVDHIEVLQDGAAAQYGTDAIAGVINIILKNASSGGSAEAQTGAYFKGDGFTWGTSANAGFDLGGKGFLNLTAEYRYHGHSNRGEADPRITPDNGYKVGESPYKSRVFGDGRQSPTNFMFNAGYDVSSAVQLYAFGSYSHKDAKAWENYRLYSKIPAPYTGKIYPNGFEPAETLVEDDYAFTAGARGGNLLGWNWDVSSTYGTDNESIGNTDGINISLLSDTGSSPTSFHAGDFIVSQWTNNADLTREFNFGLYEPVNVAIGLEYRRETYELKPGDAASRYKEGSQAFPGYALTDASNVNRDNVAAYVDLSTHLTKSWLVDLAGRFEHFSDFGDTTIGKLTTRYDLTNGFGLRATVSTGFRAPTLQEEYFSATNVAPTYAVVQLPANRAAAALLGSTGLKPEETRNYSVGFVSEPISKFHLTADAYQIEIDNRIVDTGYLVADPTNPKDPVFNAITANGNVLDRGLSFIAAQYFTNAVSTRTRGLEITADYTTEFSNASKIDWTLALNFNQTAVTKTAPTPKQLAGQTLFDQQAYDQLTKGSPKVKAVLGATYTLDRWSFVARESLYGRVAEYLQDQDTGGAPYHQVVSGQKLLTDIEVSYDLMDSWRLSAGANNVFNTFPTRSPVSEVYLGQSIYPSFAPFGINGGYYFAKVRYSF